MGMSQELPSDGFQAVALIPFDNVNQLAMSSMVDHQQQQHHQQPLLNGDHHQHYQWSDQPDYLTDTIHPQPGQSGQQIQTQTHLLLVSEPAQLIEPVAKPVQVVLSPVATAVNIIQVPSNVFLTDTNSYIVIPPEGLTLEVPAVGLTSINNNYTNYSSYNSYNSYSNEDLTLDSMPEHMQDNINNSNTEKAKLWYNDAEIAYRGLAAYSTMSPDSDQEQLVVAGSLSLVSDDPDKSDTDLNNVSLMSTVSVDDHDYDRIDQQSVGYCYATDSQASSIGSCDSSNDINLFLASTLSSTEVAQEPSPAQARRWYSDSLVSYRAMAAFKKTPVGKSGIKTHVL